MTQRTLFTADQPKPTRAAPIVHTTLHVCPGCGFAATVDAWEDGGIDDNSGDIVCCPKCSTWISTRLGEGGKEVNPYPLGDSQDPANQVAGGKA